MIDAILLLSFLWLIGILFFLQKSQLDFFSVFFPFVVSENNALDLFKYQPKIRFVDILLGVFFLIQLSLILYLLGIRLPLRVFAHPIAQFGLLLGVVSMLFTSKILIYNTIKPLLPNKQAVSYYGFNYAYWCFYFGIVLFVINLIFSTQQFIISDWILIGLVAIFYIFLVLRLITISLRYNLLRSVYIFLYFCALEIAPFAMILIGIMRF